MTTTSDRAKAAVFRVADAVGGLMEFWGFKRNMGRMWTVLYLEPEPLSAADLAERLQMSAGAVSMTLSELSKWGVVRKLRPPGERRDYFDAETSIWKMVSRVFRERELRQIQIAIESFEEAKKALADADTDGKTRERLRFSLDRIQGLLNLARTGERILDSILAGRAVDASALEEWSKRNAEK
jgi:DNA-binding transcriptional regulator GbsR (MarR family)